MLPVCASAGSDEKAKTKKNAAAAHIAVRFNGFMAEYLFAVKQKHINLEKALPTSKQSSNLKVAG